MQAGSTLLLAAVSSSLESTRSGRARVPPLQFWRNERISTSASGVSQVNVGSINHMQSAEKKRAPSGEMRAVPRTTTVCSLLNLQLMSKTPSPKKARAVALLSGSRLSGGKTRPRGPGGSGSGAGKRGGGSGAQERAMAKGKVRSAATKRQLLIG